MLGPIDLSVLLLRSASQMMRLFMVDAQIMPQSFLQDCRDQCKGTELAVKKATATPNGRRN